MQKNKIPSLVSILILTLITAVIWVSFSIYRSITTQAPPPVPENISQPLTPTLDQDAINKVESGILFGSSQIPQNVASATPPTGTGLTLPTPTAFATPTPTATASASPSATPVATP